MLKRIIALISGLLFGIGLTVSQMVDPAKVLGFLDIFGAWDPSLLFVMGAAFLVFSISYWFLIRERSVSISGDPMNKGNSSPVSKQLIIGAIIFGIGWGMTGLCPGPVLANISSGDPKILVFVVVMLFGMKVSEWLKTRLF